MNAPIPWNAPAVVGLKQPRNSQYVPQLAGLTLNQAVEHVVQPEHPLRVKFCIWVDWDGKEVMLERRNIFMLSVHPERPPLE